jgi:ketosteroid isomerase-like protein
MSGSKTNVEIVAAAYEAMARADLDALLALCALEVTITQADELPWGGHYVGRDGVLEFAAKLISTIDSKVEIDTIFEAGDHVVQRGRTRGTVRETGAPFDIAEVHVWTVRSGALMAAEFYIDTPAMLDALNA